MDLKRVIAIEEHFVSPAIAEAGPQMSPDPRMVERLLDLGEVRISAMDEAGIDVALLTHNAPGVANLEPAPAVELARQSNDELAAACREHPTRFAGLTLLPTPDPVGAAAELERGVTDLGLKGGVVIGTSHGRFLDDEFFDPILAAAARLGVPIFLHPGPPPPAVIEAYYSGFSGYVGFMLGHAGWGWHIDAGLHLVRLVLSGAFDRHPNLHMVTGHMGQGLPFMLARIEDVFDAQSGLERPVRDYFLENISYGTTGFMAPGPVASALEVFGPDRLMFAVDYPYDDNVARVADLKAMDPAIQERIAHINAERVFGI